MESAESATSPFLEWRQAKAELIDMTTLHGLRRAADQTGTVSPIRRYIWAFLIAIGLGAIIIITLDQIKEYKLHPTSTKMTIMHLDDPLLFPAVTICSLNRFYRYSNVTEWDVSQINAYDLAELTFSEDIAFGVIEEEILKETGAEMTISQQKTLLSEYQTCNKSIFRLPIKKKNLLQSIFGVKCGKYWDGKHHRKSIQQLLDTYGFNINDSLIYCQFGNGRSRFCSKDNFIPIYSTKYGRCWSFNSERSGQPSWYQKRSGIAGGLRIEIKNPQDLFIERKIKETPTGAGIKVTLHSPNEPPDVDEHGFFVGPGFHSFAQVEMTKEEYLKPPWGKCISDQKNYTRNDAEHTCYRKLSMKHCGCILPTYAKSSSEKMCSAVNLATCVFDIKWNTNRSQSKAYTPEWSSCTKPEACSNNKYKASVSSVVWPSAVVKSKDYAGLNVSKEKFHQDYLILNIYYPEMKYNHIKEVTLVYFKNLLSKIGGTTGLFLGASLLTVVELLEVLVFYCTRHIKTTHNAIIKWRKPRRKSSSSLKNLLPNR